MGFTKGDKSSRNFSKLVNALLYSSKGAVLGEEGEVGVGGVVEEGGGEEAAGGGD